MIQLQQQTTSVVSTCVVGYTFSITGNIVQRDLHLVLPFSNSSLLPSALTTPFSVVKIKRVIMPMEWLECSDFEV